MKAKYTLKTYIDDVRYFMRRHPFVKTSKYDSKALYVRNAFYCMAQPNRFVGKVAESLIWVFDKTIAKLIFMTR